MKIPKHIAEQASLAGRVIQLAADRGWLKDDLESARAVATILDGEPTIGEVLEIAEQARIYLIPLLQRDRATSFWAAQRVHQ